MMPISRLARKLAFNDSGSISAPARNVNTALPSNARKLIQSVFAWRCKKFPATTPTRISINATEMPVQIEMSLATRANAIQIAATNQTLSNIKTPTDTLLCLQESLALNQSGRFPEFWEGKLHCPRDI